MSSKATTTTGDGAHATTTGDEAHATTTGYGAHAMSALGAAQAAQGVAVGRWVMLSEYAGGTDALVLPEYGYRPMLVSVHDGWPADTWITMRDGVVRAMPDVLLPNDGRSYQLRYEGGRYVAGCRRFATAAEAGAHWSNPNHEAPRSARLLREAVERHAQANGGAL